MMSFRIVPGSTFYVASKTHRASIWKKYREAGAPIISTWIDEAGENETASMYELWSRISREVRASSILVLYAPWKDAPWKGAFVEVGMAFDSGKGVLIVAPGVEPHERQKLLGSWINYNVVFYDTLDQVFGLNCGY